MINLTLDQVKLFYRKIIDKTGGTYGIRDEGLVDSALNRGVSTFDGEYLYKSDVEKISAITHSLISNHAFTDGNKRIGVSVMLLLLKMNNILIEYTQKELIEFGLSVAAGEIGSDGIVKWINSHSK